MPTDQRFRWSERLRLHRDYARVFAAKRSHADAALVVYVSANGLAWSRLGRIVSRRVGNAVCRNRIRRRLVEAFRTQKADLPRGLDIICIARTRAADKNWDLARSLHRLVWAASRRLDRASRE